MRECASAGGLYSITEVFSVIEYNKLDLIEFYNKMGLPYLRPTEEDLDEELAAYRAYKMRAAV